MDTQAGLNQLSHALADCWHLAPAEPGPSAMIEQPAWRAHRHIQLDEPDPPPADTTWTVRGSKRQAGWSDGKRSGTQQARNRKQAS